MKSDELFWRIVLRCDCMEDAIFLWWLAVMRSDQRWYWAPPHTFEKIFGLSTTDVVRARHRFEAVGLVRTRASGERSVECAIDGPEFAAWLHACGHEVQPGRMEPLQADPLWHLPVSTLGARLTLQRRHREDAVLLLGLAQWDRHAEPLQVSGRKLERWFQGWVAWSRVNPSLERLQQAGVVRLAPCLRAGSDIVLDRLALTALLRQPVPGGADLRVITPGWSDLRVPLTRPTKVSWPVPICAAPSQVHGMW